LVLSAALRALGTRTEGWLAGLPGTRNHKDMKTGKDVDLMSEAQRLGLEAMEIGDLYQGFEFMTGVKLERPDAIAESELELDPKTQALLRAKVMGWKARVERELGGLKEEAKRSGNAIQAAGSLIQVANQAFENAQRFERNSYLGPALNGYAEAAIAIAAASRMAHAVSYLARRDLDSLLQLVQTAQNVKPEVEAFGKQLEVKAQAQSLGGQLSTAGAYASYVTARSATMIGDDFLAGAVDLLKQLEAGEVPKTRENREALMMRVTVPTLYYGIAGVYLEYAKDTQDLISDQGSAPPIAEDKINRIVAGYASAAAAVLAYFDALIVDEVATTNKVSPDEAQILIAQREPEYYLARKANILSEYANNPVAADKQDKPSDGAVLMRLAAAASAYLGGAKLVNKWYCSMAISTSRVNWCWRIAAL